MRKFLFGIMAMMGFFMMWSCSESAPTLVGEWQCDSVMPDDGGTMKMTFKMNLKADGAMENSVDAVMDSEEDGLKIHMPFGLQFGGTWTSDDKTLTLNIDSATVKTNFVADSLKISTDDPEKKAMLEMLQSKLVKSFEEQMKDPKSDLMKGFKTESDVMDYVLTETELTVTSQSDSTHTPQVFKRVK